MIRKRSRWTLAAWACLSAGLALAQTGWLERVPASERGRQNPLASQPAAVSAGRALYLEKCAKCHGQQAEGLGSRPSLHSERTAREQDGEFFWILQHGSKFNGMPAWNDLPEQQLWQLVAYLRSMQAGGSPAPPGSR